MNVAESTVALILMFLCAVTVATGIEKVAESTPAWASPFCSADIVALGKLKVADNALGDTVILLIELIVGVGMENVAESTFEACEKSILTLEDGIENVADGGVPSETVFDMRAVALGIEKMAERALALKSASGVIMFTAGMLNVALGVVAVTFAVPVTVLAGLENVAV